MAYCASSDVSNELGGFTLNSSSTPTSTVVSGWITDSEAEIDARIGMTATSTATTDIYDYSGGLDIFLESRPVISVSKVYYNEQPIGETASWTELTADTDYVTYLDFGIVRLVEELTPAEKKIKVEYSYGESTIPYNIKRLATLITARRVLLSVVNKSNTSEGGSISIGPISINDPSRFSLDNLQRMDKEIEGLYNAIGTLRTFQYNKLW